MSDVNREVIQEEEGSLLTSFKLWGQTGGLYSESRVQTGKKQCAHLEFGNHQTKDSLQFIRRMDSVI